MLRARLGTGVGLALIVALVLGFASPAAAHTQGCTPGYWRNHLTRWIGFTPGQTIGSVFVVPASLSSLSTATLLQALDFGGGPGDEGAARNLLRAAVAGLLNAAHPSVSYPASTGQIMAAVNSALASLDRGAMLGLAAQLDAANNLGCPIN